MRQWVLKIQQFEIKNSENELKAQQLQTENELVSWNTGWKNSPGRHRKGVKKQNKQGIKLGTGVEVRPSM